MMKNAHLCLVLALVIAACHSVPGWQKQEVKMLEAQGAERIVENTPMTAAALNILPGFGDIYNEKWGVFVLDLLLWPFSIVWGIPQAYQTAQLINTEATWNFYMHGPGKGRYVIDGPEKDE